MELNQNLPKALNEPGRSIYGVLLQNSSNYVISRIQIQTGKAG